MRTESQTAIACFQDNFSQLADAHLNPEKFNLYRGLGFMASAIQEIERRLSSIEKELKKISSSQR